MKEILILVLGWLLGLFSSPITDSLKEASSRRSLRKALLAELDELRCRLAGVAFMAAQSQHLLTADLIRRLQRVYANYEGPLGASRRLAGALKELAGSEDEQIEALIRASQNAETHWMNKQFSIPLLEQAVPSLSLFEPPSQRELLEVRTQLHMLNEITTERASFFRMTFDPATMVENEEKILGNMAAAEKHTMERALIIIDRIDNLRLWKTKS